MGPDTSLKDCTCEWCNARRQSERLLTAPTTFNFSGLEQAAKAFSSVGVPVFRQFEPVSADAIPVGEPELHTAESLLEAVEREHENDNGYKVYRLGALIIDLSD